MFKNAAASISGAVRPMHVIRRRFSDNAILPDIATLFFVNENGYAVTSKRIANIIKAASNTDQMYRTYLEKRSNLSRDESYRFTLKRLENDMIDVEGRLEHSKTKLMHVENEREYQAMIRKMGNLEGQSGSRESELLLIRDITAR
jgi:predicted  nucleic acid-binding Zn-ribbon protein